MAGIVIPSRDNLGSLPRKYKAHRFTCNICGKSSTRSNNFKAHLKTHDPDRERRFRCSTCSKGFFRKVDLKRHEGVIKAVQLYHDPDSMLTFKRSTRMFVHMYAAVVIVSDVRMF